MNEEKYAQIMKALLDIQNQLDVIKKELRLTFQRNGGHDGR